MKKAIFASILAGVMAFGLAACSSGGGTSESSSEAESATSSSSTVKSATEDGVLTVGFDAEYPPYGYMDDNGEYTGFDLELADAVCQLEGWALEKKPISWDAKDSELASYSIDCIWNGFTRNGRESDYTFSVSYVDNSQVIVTAQDSGITTLADLAGKTIGVQQASAALDVLTGEDSDMKSIGDSAGAIEQFADYNTAFTELEAGALDALAIDIGVANYQLSTRGDGFIILDEYLNSEEYAVGCRLGDTELADIISEDLQTLTNDGTVAELAEKYGIADMIILEVE